MKYYGTIKTKQKALALADKIEKNGHTCERSKGMVLMLRNNWHAIAARPTMQPEIIAMAESTALYRKGSIIDVIINGGRM